MQTNITLNQFSWNSVVKQMHQKKLFGNINPHAHTCTNNKIRKKRNRYSPIEQKRVPTTITLKTPSCLKETMF